VRELRGLSKVDNRSEFRLGELKGSYFGAPTWRRNGPDALKSYAELRSGAILMCKAAIKKVEMFRK